MQMSLQMSSKIAKAVPTHSKATFNQKPYKLTTLSCKANELGMQKGKNKNNFYEVLSLNSSNVGADDIKRAYRSMALRYHPDVCPPWQKEESTRRFVELQEAYETLSDPLLRQMYDYQFGFLNPIGHGAEAFYGEERRSIFPREVWEKQLNGLKQRSLTRMEGKRNAFTCRKSLRLAC